MLLHSPSFTCTPMDASPELLQRSRWRTLPAVGSQHLPCPPVHEQVPYAPQWAFVASLPSPPPHQHPYCYVFRPLESQLSACSGLTGVMHIPSIFTCL